MKPYRRKQVSFLLLPVALVLTICSGAIFGFIGYLTWVLVDRITNYLFSIDNPFIEFFVKLADAIVSVDGMLALLGLIITCILLLLAVASSSWSLRLMRINSSNWSAVFGFLLALVFQGSGYYYDFIAFQHDPNVAIESGVQLSKNIQGYFQYKSQQDIIGFWLSLIFNFCCYQSWAISSLYSDNKTSFYEDSKP
jgi:hypothetical protein